MQRSRLTCRSRASTTLEPGTGQNAVCVRFLSSPLAAVWPRVRPGSATGWHTQAGSGPTTWSPARLRRPLLQRFRCRFQLRPRERERNRVRDGVDTARGRVPLRGREHEADRQLVRDGKRSCLRTPEQGMESLREPCRNGSAALAASGRCLVRPGSGCPPPVLVDRAALEFPVPYVAELRKL